MTLSLTSSLDCQPRWATSRTDRKSLGPQVARVAERLGQILMPWQRLVADVGMEINPETGLPAYREIIIEVPRQSGKTTLMLALECHRALLWGSPQRIAYTAQTGWDARKKLIEDQAPLLQSSELAPAVERVLRGVGNEAIIFKGGSRIDVLASSESAGHGRTLDLGVIDEAFADLDFRREQAILPAMATRPSGQLIVVSTAGTDSSVLLRRKVDAGRAAVADGATSGIAYFEWSAPDDADPDDPATWWACMPALGIVHANGSGITEETVRHARMTMTDDEFRRAFLNQWTGADERVIPAAAWAAVCAFNVVPSGNLTFGLDCTHERDGASIVSVDDDRRCELVDHREGVSWVVSRSVELYEKWKVPFVVDVGGPAGVFIAELERAGVKVVSMTGRDVAYACAAVFDAVADRTIKVRTHPALDLAVDGARRRSLGDAWVWARRDSGCDISPLVALTLAAAHRAAPKIVLASPINLGQSSYWRS